MHTQYGSGVALRLRLYKLDKNSLFKLDMGQLLKDESNI